MRDGVRIGLGVGLGAVTAALGLLAAACSAEGVRCAPGQSVRCACPGLGLVGAQVCQGDGLGFSDCVCSGAAPASGGSAGFGTSSSGGATTTGGAMTGGAGGASAGRGGSGAPSGCDDLVSCVRITDECEASSTCAVACGQAGDPPGDPECHHLHVESTCTVQVACAACRFDASGRALGCHDWLQGPTGGPIRVNQTALCEPCSETYSSVSVVCGPVGANDVSACRMRAAQRP